eukprot:TRINITY_DN10838_c0_g1_i2.p1 TRINITY_DN10838_c0_g1~~TRINITY_DN10838_c0_g1_i2.p1  ORF type:complete len:471 (+),score=39.86 TRINITY_DN10838_c0_g1_i2:43-1455(+)
MHALKMQEPAALQTECLHRLVGMRAEDWQDAGRKFHAACAYDRQVAAAKCAAEAEIAAQQTTHKTSKRRSPLLCMPPAKTRRIDKEKPKPRRTRMWDCAPTGGVPVVRAAPDVLEHDSATVGTHAVRRVLTILGLQSVPFHQQYIASVLHHLVYALASASLHGIIKSARSTINACARVLLPHLVLRTLEHWADPSLQLGDMRRDVEAACNEFAALADGDVEEDFCGPEAEFESRELQKLCSPCALLLIRMVPFDAVAVPSESADFATGDGWFWKRAEEVATKPRRPCSGLTVHCTDFSHVGSLVSFWSSPGTPILQTADGPRLPVCCLGPHGASLQTNGRGREILQRPHSRKDVLVLQSAAVLERSAPFLPSRCARALIAADVDKIVLSFMCPRALRCAEQTCLGWARLIHSDEWLCRLLRMSSAVTRSYIRFFTEEWGAEELRLDYVMFRLRRLSARLWPVMRVRRVWQ